MTLYFYRKNHLEKQYADDIGSQIMIFLEDIAKIYPGWTDEARKEGLFLKDFDLPTVESEEINYLLSPK